MDIKEFIEKFAEAVEIEDASALRANTSFKELDEWSSLSALSVMAFFDEEFDRQLLANDLKNAVTIEDLFNLIKE